MGELRRPSGLQFKGLRASRFPFGGRLRILNSSKVYERGWSSVMSTDCPDRVEEEGQSQRDTLGNLTFLCEPCGSGCVLTMSACAGC